LTTFKDRLVQIYNLQRIYIRDMARIVKVTITRPIGYIVTKL